MMTRTNHTPERDLLRRINEATPINPFLSEFPVASPFAVDLHEPREEGSYEYRLRELAPDVPGSETDSGVDGVEVEIRWGHSLLHVANLKKGESFSIDDRMPTKGKRYPLPVRVLPEEPQLLIESGRLLMPTSDTGATEFVSLAVGEQVTVKLEEFTITARGIKLGRRFPAALKLFGGFMLFALGSFIAHGALGLTLAALMPNMGIASDDSLSDDQRELVTYFLKIDAETETKAPPPTAGNDEPGSATSNDGGASSPGEAGAAGNPTLAGKSGRAAVRDSGEEHEAQLSRNAGLRLASEFGMVGLLNQHGGDPEAPTSPFGGDFSHGSDALSTQGNLWSDDIGGYGPGGLGISGIGEGGDGGGDFIGMNGVRTVGIGPGGPGGFAGRCLNCKPGGRHGTKPPRLRSAGISQRGTLPPAVIQRIVRNNFGRFRYCYKRALDNNPSLQGRVIVSFVISRSGSVSGASAGGDLPDAGVHACVASAFSGLSFPAPEKGIVTVSYPIMFSPGA
ncbi:MAG: AgmX/PglI C-terminal domain-containing protein [Polyangiaceae bacterium]